MQESNKPTNEEAFWKSPQESVEVGLEHLAEDKELEVSQVKAKFRHRLVGAVVLVAALATVLPIFFEEPAIQSDRHAETKIPPITKEPFYKMELPVNNRPAVSMPADQSALKDLSKPNVVKDAPEARPTPELDQKQNEVQTYASSTEGSLYIQVLATSSEAGAMREMARYQAMGLPVYSVKVQKKSATLWRVRLGLFKTKEEAERVAKVLDSRKISHMPVQVEESAKRDMNRIAPTRTLKSAAQEAHSRSQEQKAKTPAAQPAKAKSQPIKNATPAQPKAVKPATAAKTSQPVKKETAPKATQKVSSKKSASDDPLADLLKSTREDVIAQKLRESGHK
mgnify:FL=1